MSYSDEILDFQEETRQNPEMYLASHGQRLTNNILDTIFFYVIFFLIALPLEILEMGLFGADEEMSGLGWLFSITIYLGYFVITEYYFGKTFAKFITRTKVVTEKGRVPKFWTIVGRTLCRNIPFEPFSFLGNKPVGWHDSISKTRVVTNEYNTRDEYI